MRIAAIPGEGIGAEVLPAAPAVIDAAVQVDGDSPVSWTWFDWGCDRFHDEGSMMPADGLQTLSEFDAIFLGAVGLPDVPDDVSLWELLIPIRRAFDQYVNLRPIRLFDGVSPRVTVPEGRYIDLLIVRENTEGEYSESGGRFMRGTEREFAVQNDIFTRIGIERIARYACESAAARRGATRPPDFGDQVERHHPHHALLGRGGGRGSSRLPVADSRQATHRRACGGVGAASL